MEQVSILNKTHKISLYLLVFLLPLWFLPLTQDILIFQKQMVLFILVFVSLIAWLTKVIRQGEFELRFNWLHWPVLAIIVASAFSTIFSLWPYGSFWGWPLNVSDSFLTILFLGLLYFLVSNTLKDQEELLRLFLVLISSVAIAGLYAILQLYQVFIIPVSFIKVSTFNTIGNVSSVGLLAAILLPIVLALAFNSRSILRWWLWFFALVFLAIILLINFFNIWLVLVSGLIVLLVFGMLDLKKKGEAGWLSLAMALLVLSLFFMFFRLSMPISPRLPVEVYPSFRAEAKILGEVIKHYPLLGTGPGTFVFDYSKYREASLNQTVFWGTRFTSGFSEIIDWFITKGIIGGTAFVILIGMVIFFGFRSLINDKTDKLSWAMRIGFLAGFAGIVMAYVFHSSPLTLYFVFWLLVGALSMATGHSIKKIIIVSPSLSAVFCSSALLIVLISGLGLLFVGAQKYAAEIQYFSGSKALAKQDLQKGINKIASAAGFNPSIDFYWRDLAQLYLSQVGQISADKNLSDEQKQQQTQKAVSSAILSANQAIAVNPANVENWNVRGFVYRNLIGIQNADILAVESYTKASQLEPASPFAVTELGRVYLAQAQSFGSDKNVLENKKKTLEMALENLNKAVALKTDYAPANYLIAVVYEQQGKLSEAIAKLKETTGIAPNDIGLAFQLGVMYYNNNQYDKARVELERAKSLNENYANARYMLGLVYDKQGQKDKAIKEFRKVAQFDPDNNQVRKILENLRNDKPALTDIQVSQPPIQENPPEIGKKEK